MKINSKIQKFNGDAHSLLPATILARWETDVKAVNDDDDTTINMYDVIGWDAWTETGMTEKIVSSILRRNKGKAITVNINSGGGDFFQGVAIYNLLKQHDGEINVNVVGMAASAASVIAMAGDNIKVAKSGFIMIHNSWNISIGNKNDFRDMAETLDKFDESMVGVYQDKTGINSDEIAQMMDDETWIGGTDAVEMGFATALLDEEEKEIDDSAKSHYNAEMKAIDVALAKGGMSRSERRKAIKSLTNTPSAIDPEDPTPSAGTQDEDFAKAVKAFKQKIS